MKMDETMQRHDFNRNVKQLKIIAYMKRIPKAATSILCAAAFCAVVLAGPSAKATPINGSLAFSVLGVTVDSPNLADATTFSVTGTFIAMNPTGTYSTVPVFTSVTFNGFTFNPAVASVTPLWTFTLGPLGDQTVYSFDATSVEADYNASIREWDIGGTGLAMITGYTTTVGSWTVNLSQTDASFAFDATSGSHAPLTTVPDWGSGLAVLGSAFLGLGAFSRKFCC